MRLFVCEFITCGGMRDQPVPGHLLSDAETMQQAVLTDLRKIHGVEIITTRDNRLTPVPESVTEVRTGDDVWRIWEKYMQTSDAVWGIAPESEGTLLKMHNLARNSGAVFVGCGAQAIEITTSKLKTARRLSALGIPCIDTFRSAAVLPPSDHGWIVKPDEGAGTEDCYYFEAAGEFDNWREGAPDPERFIIQPYIPGNAASLSVLYQKDQTLLLSCNEQKFRIKDGIGHHDGVIVNGLKDKHALFEPVAVKIGQAVPGLRGYVGIDIILTAAGPVVVEVNPRMTTSYAGLRRSLGINVAEKVLEIFKNELESVALSPAAGIATIDMGIS